MILFGVVLEAAAPGYPYWPDYEIADKSAIVPQAWNPTDHVIEGWDWSLPPEATPSPRGIIGMERKIGLSTVPQLQPQFPVNAAFIQWVYWREIEPDEGAINWQPLLDRIAQCEQYGQRVIIRILAHTQSRNGDLTRGHAPRWLENKGITMADLPASGTGVLWTSYDPADPIFHSYYLNLIDSLRQSGIPQMDTVQAMYVGYASVSLGDEGIGPKGMDPANEPQHVRERLDAWAAAAAAVTHKIFMGGPSEYGFAKGFGVRRGFVEKYLYTIPDTYIGQQVDSNGYLYVDEDAWVVRMRAFHGEVNEEYGPEWATASTNFRFGENTDSFSYRYFMSNLRLVQMRCTYVHNAHTLMPQMLPWVAQQLGRTVDDAPDVWSYLNTSYLFKYPQLKNFERWLYQRDSTGFETVPVEPISNEPIGLWMVSQEIDHMAKKGQNIGFAIDDRFIGTLPTPVAIKVSYLDKINGTLTVNFKTATGPGSRTVAFANDGKLKTATFIVDDFVAPASGHDYDLTFHAEEGAEISMVRVVKMIDTSFASFSQKYGLTEGALGDDDRNGISNLAEFAFGGNPLDAADRGWRSGLTIAGNEVVLTYTRRTAQSSGLNYRIEYSTDMRNWFADGLQVQEITPVTAQFEHVSARFQIPVGDPLILRVTTELGANP